MNLDQTQQRAVDMAITKRVSVITGGPGTGKTTIIKTVLEKLGDRSEIAICAPTGKAARRLYEQTGHPASTIHRLLAYGENGFTFDYENRLPYSTVIVDEASMVDIELGASLLSAVTDNTRLVWVGDADQLPSVGPGNLLRDLIASGQIPVTRLTEIYRQRSDSVIPHNAAAINRGKLPEPGPQFYIEDIDDAKDVADRIVELISKEIPQKHGFTPSDTQLLCPQRNGPVGVNLLNERLQEQINPSCDQTREWTISKKVLREDDRVMHVKNNYNLKVMNGEIGKIDAIYDDVLQVNFGDHCVEYNKSDARQLVLCYATTIHKSQGSEYPAVVIPVHSTNSYMLSRSLLYTAVTRGKQLVWLVGNRKGLQRAVRNATEAKRYSELANLLRNASQQGLEGIA